MGIGVLGLRGGKPCCFGRFGEVVQRVRINLCALVTTIVPKLEMRITLAMRARRNDRTRNLKRSSSVCMMIRRKLVLGSMLPVCSSTSSILLTGSVPSALFLRSGYGEHTCCRTLSMTRSINGAGQGSISGALRSVTHARVSACRSRTSWGKTS